jgi:stage III sporulation protein AG
MNTFRKLAEKLGGAKYALLVLLLGALLLLLPRCGGSGKSAAVQTSASSPEGLRAPDFDLAAQEAKLSAAVSSVAGAGRTQVVLAVRSSAMRERAAEDGEAVVVSQGSGKQAAVELRWLYPEYRGALVVCQGAADPQVRLAVTEAVRALTGLGADKITVLRAAD